MEWLNFDKRLIPMDQWIQQAVDWLVMNYRDIFQIIKLPVEKTLDSFDWALNTVHPLIIIALFAFLSWKFSGKRLAVFTVFTMFLIGWLGLWEDAMTTLAMVLCAVLFCAIVGVPLGIASGRSDKFEFALRPVLDAMQTTPAFVYLVPVVMLFSIGTVSGVLATIIFAMPPIIRLTSLGIRQVHPELVEAAEAFGATSWQTLRKVQIPLAMPSIMAGLNQTIMMSLSMVVIAALIGAGGLGTPVFQGLNTLDIGLATIGGLAIVLMAMVLDRITQGLGK
ncbi:ABC transporter permease [Limisalsivibrio acetivorans]|uniref:ABC transporter permease n=1 Tax=Limisalsivibrio acetivorans TaxID=1304888 RepID=UPI0003B42FF4|nr:proline/glycine betaine ABC transporter permease [Limisalsivibrio acetivorans]